MKHLLKNKINFMRFLFIVSTFLLFLISPLYAQNNLRGFADVLGFENIGPWKGLVTETQNVKQGKRAGAWFDTVKNDRIACKQIPHNLSMYNALSIWIYSETDNEAEIVFVLGSENDKTSGKDYYQFAITLNWKGWKKVLIPFESFTKKRNPVGFKKIDNIKLASSSYSISRGPLSSTHLILDDLEFVKVDKQTILNSYADAMSFENVGLWKGPKKNTQYVKQGKYSGAWTDTVKINRFKTASVPKDWSDFNAIGFWLYSAVNNHAEIEMIVDSENPKTDHHDRYRTTIFINWKGWKYIKIRFDQFRADNMPIGWNKVDGIQFASSGYSKFPKVDTKLYFDDMKLIKDSLILSKKTSYKYFDDSGNYINSVVISVKNFLNSKQTLQVSLNKSELNKFQFKGNLPSLALSPKETKEITLNFVINKKYLADIDKLYSENIHIEFSSSSNKKGEIDVSLYGPYYKLKPIPPIFLTSEDIAKAKERYKKYEWAKKTINNFQKVAKQYSSHKIPQRGGGFLHGGPTAKYYPISVIHENMTRAARYYAILYKILGNKKYLNKSKKILMAYSDLLPKLPLQDKYGNVGEKAKPAGGRWTVQILSDCKLLIFLGFAYDLIRDEMTPEERSKFENNVLRLEADTLMLNNEGRHNHQIWYSSTLAVVGYLLGDGEYIDRALNDKEVGFFPRILKDSFTPSGWYYERSTGYQYYVLFAMTWFLEAAYHAGDNYYKIPLIKKIYTVPFQILSSDFKFPIINDGRGINPLEEARAWVDIVAYQRYQDPSFLPVITRVDKNASLYTLLHGDFVDITKKPNLSLSSVLFPVTGWSVIRANRPINHDFFFFLDFSPHIASHVHPDRLDLLLYAFNDYVMPDPGSLKYRSKYHINWMRSTIAHNTMCVDMKNQNDYRKVMPAPQYTFYNISPRLKGIQVIARKVYDGVNFKRTVLMIDDAYILDRFQCESKESHTYDLAYHIKGTPQYVGFSVMPKKNFYEKNPSYSLIDDFAVKRKTGDVVVNYRLNKENGIYLHYLGDEDKKIKLIAGKGALSTLYEELSKQTANVLILRKEQAIVDYSTLLEPYSQEPNILKVEKNDLKTSMMYTIKRENGIKDLVLLNDTKQKNGNNELNSDASVVYVKYKSNKVVYIFANHCSSIQLLSGAIHLSKPSDFYIEKKNNSWFFKNMGKNISTVSIDGKILGISKKINRKVGINKLIKITGK